MSKSKDAGSIKEMAAYRYNILKKEYEECNLECNKSLNAVDDIKAKIWIEFGKFVDTVQKIKNINELKGQIAKEDCNFAKSELKEIKVKSVSVTNGIKTAAVTGTVAVGGTAAATVALGGIGLSAFGIGTTVGEAAALTMSMAEVTVAVYGASVIFWPMAIVAAAATVAGSVYSGISGNVELKKAKVLEADIDKACAGLSEATGYLKEIIRIGSEMQNAMDDLYDFYTNKLNELEKVVAVKNDYREFEQSEKYLLEATLLLTKVLKNMTMIPLLVKRDDSKVGGADDESAPVVNTNAVENVIKDAQEHKKAITEFTCEPEKVKIMKTVQVKNIQDYYSNTENAEFIISKSIVLGKGHLRFTDCKFVFDGGSIKCEKNDLVFNNCSFTGKGNDACFNCEYGSLIFEECSVNKTTNFIFGSSITVKINNSVFSDNIDILKGQYSSVLLNGTSISTTKGSIIDINVLDEKLVCHDCVFENCHSENVSISYQGGYVEMCDCKFLDLTGIYVGFIGEFLNSFSQIKNCIFEKCKGLILFQGAIVRDCEFLKCESRDGNRGNGAFKVLTGGNDLVRIEGCADAKDRHLLSQITGCTFKECKAGDSIISVNSYLKKKGICISINNNIFEKCRAGSEIINTCVLDFGMFNKIKSIEIATVSGNKFN